LLKIFAICTDTTENLNMSIIQNDSINSRINSRSTMSACQAHAEQFKLFGEKPLKIFKGHLNDIIDVCWGINNSNIILSASLDKSILMWDLTKDTYIHKFEHSNMVTCLSFCPNNENLFVSGCLDKIVRIWDTTKKKVVDYINVQDLITSITYFPSGDQIAIGFHNGKISVYDIIPKLKYNTSFDCRNRFGKYSKGRKVTGLEFINNHDVLVTTNDSRIRLLNIKENKLKEKNSKDWKTMK